MEIVTLIGIIVTILITIVGWFVTYRTQLKILTDQTDYQYHKDQQRLLIDNNLTFVNDLEMWFEKGRIIYLTLLTMSPLQIERLKATDIDEIERIAVIRKIENELEKHNKVFEECKQLRAEEPRLFYLAKIYDPLANQSPLWNWGNSQMPHDLPQIMDNFENEVLDKLYEIFYGEKGRAFPIVEDQFYALHEAGIQALERIKGYLIFQEISKGVKK